jgi:hypothetical protein
MNPRPHSRSFARLAIAVATTGAALVFAAGCAVATAETRDAGVRFADGWQANTKPLIFHGAGPLSGRTFWLVPATLPKGTYRVITRDEAGNPHLVDGQRFTVTSDAFRDLTLLMDNFVHAPEAIDERYVTITPPSPGQNPTSPR